MCTRMWTGGILGGVGSEVEKIMREEEPHLPRGTTFSLRGQIETMQSSFFRLGLGMIFAVVLVYLADDRELPILARSFHYSHGSPRRDGRYLVDAVCYRHHFERSFANGRQSCASASPRPTVF